MTITQAETEMFEGAVDRGVLDALANGVRSFDRLVVSLPGVYPSTVLHSLQRLESTQKISAKVWTALVKSAQEMREPLNDSYHQIWLPIPHPLDYDWRFSDSTVQHLLNECAALTRRGDAIALLGTPSLLRMGIEQSYPRQLILLEANRTVTDIFAQTIPTPQVFRCDVMRDTLPHLAAKAVVLDPPWYPEHIQSFLWAACQLCKIGGYLLISMPPVGTRPGMEREWANTLDWAQQIGLTLVKLELATLSYVTPPFEFNGLRAEGLHAVSREWRRSDLAVFSRTHQTKIPRPTVHQQEDFWQEEVLGGVRFRVRKPNLSSFADPSLMSIVPGDVLQSVSRRDSHRQLADVWTSGNRIFACRGRGVLWQILRAIAVGRSPVETVASTLEHPLSLVEAELVSHTTDRIANIISTEQKENLLFGEQHNNIRQSLATG